MRGIVHVVDGRGQVIAAFCHGALRSAALVS
jgi:hypothetical protein